MFFILLVPVLFLEHIACTMLESMLCILLINGELQHICTVVTVVQHTQAKWPTIHAPTLHAKGVG